VRVGDVFALGNHRLVCGDCTDPRIVTAVLAGDRPILMVTDAPYGVSYSGEWRDGVSGEFGGARLQMRGEVTNDDVANWESAWRLFPGDVAYTWCASLRLPQAWQGVASAGFEVRNVIIWSKPSITLSRGAYHHQSEPVLYGVRRGRAARWCGGRTQSTVWAIAGMNPAGGSRETKVGHPTQKPVECMARPMRNHGRRGDFVYDPFVGSGTSIVAAEREHRRCLAVELEPAWVQVTIDRWEALTGARASKIGEVPRG
jgi:DNA modification methylase